MTTAAESSQDAKLVAVASFRRSGGRSCSEDRPVLRQMSFALHMIHSGTWMIITLASEQARFLCSALLKLTIAP